MSALWKALHKAEYLPANYRLERLLLIMKLPSNIESVDMSLHSLTKNRGPFPSDARLMKLFCLAQRNISQKWTMPIRDWKAALNRFTIQFEERILQWRPKPRFTQENVERIIA